MINLSQLKRLAEGATKGPWKSKLSIHGNEYRYVQLGKDENYCTLELLPADARLIAACDPDTILSLISAIGLARETLTIIYAHTGVAASAMNSAAIDSLLGSIERQCVVALTELNRLMEETA